MIRRPGYGLIGSMGALAMTRLQALEAVVEAARKWQQTTMHIEPHSDDECEAYERFEDALIALDALHADPAPSEVVELSVWEHNDGAIQMVRCHTEAEGYTDGVGGWNRIGTTRLPLVQERGGMSDHIPGPGKMVSARDAVIQGLQSINGVDPEYDDGVDADAILSALAAAGWNQRATPSEVDALRAEVVRLKEALHKIATSDLPDQRADIRLQGYARAALAKEPGDEG